MEQLQTVALVAAYKAYTDRTALTTGEEAQSQQPGQDNLINMTAQQVGPDNAVAPCCLTEQAAKRHHTRATKQNIAKRHPPPQVIDQT